MRPPVPWVTSPTPSRALRSHSLIVDRVWVVGDAGWYLTRYFFYHPQAKLPNLKEVDVRYTEAW